MTTYITSYIDEESTEKNIGYFTQTKDEETLFHVGGENGMERSEILLKVDQEEEDKYTDTFKEEELLLEEYRSIKTVEGEIFNTSLFE